jgi:aminocarboxymuconate-semialdehyde decarboxylase
VDLFGAERVLLGTDYPYDMGEENPRGLVASVAGLSAEEVERIEGLNAVDLLRIVIEQGAK